MQEQIEQRLAALRREHEAGVTMLADLDNRRTELQQTLLRIGGAMQVLQEILDPGEAAEDPAPGAGAPAEDPPVPAADHRVPNGVAATT